MAEAAGTTRGNVSRIFAGERQPSRELAERIVTFCQQEGITPPKAGAAVIAAALGVEPGELFPALAEPEGA